MGQTILNISTGTCPGYILPLNTPIRVRSKPMQSRILGTTMPVLEFLLQPNDTILS